MGRLETIPEDKITTHTSDSQLEKDSRSHSKILILNKTKVKTNDLADSYPMFLDMVEQLLENIHYANRTVFNKWHVLLAHINTYAFWAERRKRVLNLRLQNAPGDDGIF